MVRTAFHQPHGQTPQASPRSIPQRWLRLEGAFVMASRAPGRERADAPTRPMAEQMHQLPMATTAAALAVADHHQPLAQAPAAEPIPAPMRPSPITTTAALLAQLPMAELRAACAAAGCRPGRSRASAVAALLGADAAAG
jgi:hypothetical protein